MLVERIGGECEVCGFDHMMQRFTPTPFYPKFEICPRCNYSKVEASFHVPYPTIWDMIIAVDGITLGTNKQSILEHVSGIQRFDSIDGGNVFA